MFTTVEARKDMAEAREDVAAVFREAALKNIAQVDGVLQGRTADGRLGYCAIGLFSRRSAYFLLQRAFKDDRFYRCPVEGCWVTHLGSMILAHLNNQTPSANIVVDGHGFDWLTIAKYVPLIEEIEGSCPIRPTP